MDDLGIDYPSDISKQEASQRISGNPYSNIDKKDRLLLKYMGVTASTHQEAEKMVEYYSDLPNTKTNLFTFIKFLIQGKSKLFFSMKKDKLRLDSWEENKYILHPKDFIYDIMLLYGDTFHGYVRNNYVGCSEKLTEDKIRDIILKISEIRPRWLLESNSSAVFLEALQQLYPGCCDGHPPAKKTKRISNEIPVFAKKSSSGCLGLLFFIAFTLFSAIMLLAKAFIV